MRRVLLAATALILVASGCSGSSPSRDDTLRALEQETIVPGFEGVTQALTDLELAVTAACRGNPGTLPSSLEKPLTRARSAWKSTEAYRAGPVMDRRSWAWIDDPGDAERVGALLAARVPARIDAEYLRTRVSASQRGLEAIEILLGRSSAGTPARRCEYLRSASAVASNEADAIVAAWRGGDSEALPEGFTVDELVGDAIALLMAMERRLSDAIRDKDIEEGFFADDVGLADRSGDDLRAGLVGLRAVLVGAEGASAGRGGLARILDDTIVDDLDRRLDALDAATADLDGSLKAAAAEDTKGAREALERIVELRRTVATQVVSHLGVTVGFSDADGDTG